MENYIGVSGNLRSQQQEKLTQDYTQILSSVWEEKPIWEHTRDNALTAAPCMTGSLYSDSPVKLMFAGRAVENFRYNAINEECNYIMELLAMRNKQRKLFK